ncbi:GNAT family protein [Porticoccaceae bacterium LTM1]|nr:GNAT family protein [Porticoccaceae bacterium LTM1]
MFRLKVNTEINLIFIQDSLADRLFEIVDSNRDHLGKWFPWVSNTDSPEPIRKFIKQAIVEFSEGVSIVCAIEYQGNVIGITSLHRINRDLKKAELGYWLALECQGKGIINKVSKRLVKYAFEDLNLEKVQIHAAEGNTRSRKVCERLGAKLEGVITNAEKIDDRIVDHAVYGIHISDNQDFISKEKIKD